MFSSICNKQYYLYVLPCHKDNYVYGAFFPAGPRLFFPILIPPSGGYEQ